jgi:hypothetical protein
MIAWDPHHPPKLGRQQLEGSRHSSCRVSNITCAAQEHSTKIHRSRQGQRVKTSAMGARAAARILGALRMCHLLQAALLVQEVRSCCNLLLLSNSRSTTDTPSEPIEPASAPMPLVTWSQLHDWFQGLNDSSTAKAITCMYTLEGACEYMPTYLRQ